MVEIDKTIYETFDDKCNTIRCRVCNKHIVKSYHLKHQQFDSHLKKLESFNNEKNNDFLLEDISKRCYEYDRLRSQTNIFRKYLVKDLDEYREKHLSNENDYKAYQQRCKVNSLVEQLGMI